MRFKKLFTLIAIALPATAVGIIIVRVWGIPFEDAISGIAVSTLYGVLALIYFLRFAFIFLGVFAGYKFLQEQHLKKIAV